MTIPADVLPFVLIGGGLALILVGYAWLQNELEGPDKGWWLVYDLIVSGHPFAFVTVGMMGAGGYLVYLGWMSLR